MNSTAPIPFYRPIDLGDLAAGMPGLTPAFCEAIAEACAVCLAERGHRSGVVCIVDGMREVTYRLAFPQATEQMLRCWNDPDEATELGACAIAVLLVRDLTEFTVIERSRKGTGFDYWLGVDGDFLFQRRARLEISGIRLGTMSDLAARTRRKVRQIRPSNEPLPAYAIVVEFSEPRARAVEK